MSKFVSFNSEHALRSVSVVLNQRKIDGLKPRSNRFRFSDATGTGLIGGMDPVAAQPGSATLSAMISEYEKRLIARSVVKASDLLEFLRAWKWRNEAGEDVPYQLILAVFVVAFLVAL